MSAPPLSLYPRPTLIRIACAVTFSFVVFAAPVLKSKSETDPLYKQFTDHIRHRYCASLMLSRPIHTLTTPLYILNQETTTRYPATTFPKDPCGQGGVLHVLFQAPFQWLLDHAGWLPYQTTNLHVLLNLFFGHLWIFLMLASRDHAWTAAFVYPWMIRTALMSVQGPFEALFGYLSFFFWVRGRRSLGLALFVATFAAYNRFLIWIPAWLMMLYWSRDEVLPLWRRQLSTWAGRAVAAGLAASFAWSLYSTLIVWPQRHPPPAGDRLWNAVFGGAFVALWCVHLYKNRRSELALFTIVYGLFLATYNGFTETWYFAPVMVLAPLAVSSTERLMWVLSVGFLSDIVLWDHGLWGVRYPLRFAFDYWSKLVR